MCTNTTESDKKPIKTFEGPIVPADLQNSDGETLWKQIQNPYKADEIPYSETLYGGRPENIPPPST